MPSGGVCTENKHASRLPPGPCWHCGKHKNNVYGLCLNCYRFGIPDNEADNKKKPKNEDIDTAGIPDVVPDFDMAEKDIVPEFGLDDRLFTEDEPEDEVVPSEVVGSGRLYTM